MLRRADPVGDDFLELLGCHSGVGGHNQFHNRAFVTGQGGRVTLEHRSEWFLPFPFRVLGCQGLDTIEDEECLDIHGLLGPQSAVVVEDGDPIGDGDEVGSAFLRHFNDKI